jgi:hypothetical protein
VKIEAKKKRKKAEKSKKNVTDENENVCILEVYELGAKVNSNFKQISC